MVGVEMAEAGRIDVLEPYRERFRELSGRQFDMVSQPFQPLINLRGDAGDPALVRTVYGVLALDLPTEPNTWTARGHRSVLWLGPDEWLLVGEKEEQADEIARLEERLISVHSSVVDVSGQRTVIDLSGANAYDILGGGCTLDLHPRYFRTGHCAQTLLGKAQVILQRRDDAPTFRIFVSSSYARYLAAWLIDTVELFNETDRSSSE